MDSAARANSSSCGALAPTAMLSIGLLWGEIIKISHAPGLAIGKVMGKHDLIVCRTGELRVAAEKVMQVRCCRCANAR